MPRFSFLLWLVAALLFLMNGSAALAQTGGQNYRASYYRLRWHDAPVRWQQFATPTGTIYFQPGTDSLCAFVSHHLAGEQTLIAHRYGSQPPGKLSIIIYPSLQALYQTNIGSDVTTAAVLPFPTFVSQGKRLLLTYNGSYRDLLTQLRLALSRTVWESNFPPSVSTQLKGMQKVPAWFSEGAIRYFGNGWPLEEEEALRELLLQVRPEDFAKVVERDGSLAGAALCYYLSRRYPPNAPAQLFFHLRAGKTLPRALRLLAKRPADSVYSDCVQWYRLRFRENNDTVAVTNKADSLRQALRVRGTASGGYRWNIDSSCLLYWREKDHRRSTYLLETSTGRQRRLARYDLPPWYGAHDADRYPLTAWDAPGSAPLLIQPKKGRPALLRFGTAGSRLSSEPLPPIDGADAVLPLSGRELLLAAWLNGQKDLVSYSDGGARYRPLTNDARDELDPAAMPDQKGSYLFAVDEPRDSGRYSAVFRIGGTQAGVLAADSLPYTAWRAPRTEADGAVSAITTRRGFSERVVIQNGSIVYSSSMQALSPWRADYEADKKQRAQEDSILAAAAAGSEPGFLDGVFGGAGRAAASRRYRDSLRDAYRYAPQKARPYALQLYSLYFGARVSNDYLINRYQPYSSYLGTFKVPNIGGMLRGGLSDLFEDHRLSTGYQLPIGTPGSDYFAAYENRQRRTAWQLLYFRKVEALQPDNRTPWRAPDGRYYPATAKVRTHYYQLQLQHPLSYYAALTGQLAARNDRTIFEATDRYSLYFPALANVFAISMLRYDVTHLQSVGPALYKGWSGNVGLDLFKQFTGAEAGVGALSGKLSYHRPLWHGINLVTRLKAAYSGGQQHVLYNLGGVDNNLTPQTDTAVRFSQAAPYAFQTLVTPMRGYYQNSLYGNAYGLLNVDVYVSLFDGLIPLRTNVSAINNLQLGLLADVARVGETFKDGRPMQWATSFGFSVRTTLAGYPLRFDMAWPGSLSKASVWYLSLSLE